MKATEILVPPGTKHIQLNYLDISSQSACVRWNIYLNYVDIT